VQGQICDILRPQLARTASCPSGHTDSHTLDSYIWGGGGGGPDIRSMSRIRPICQCRCPPLHPRHVPNRKPHPGEMGRKTAQRNVYTSKIPYPIGRLQCYQSAGSMFTQRIGSHVLQYRSKALWPNS
jgi:hypothetical protein